MNENTAVDRVYLISKWECTSTEELSPFELARKLQSALHKNVYVGRIDVSVETREGSVLTTKIVLTSKIDMNQYQTDLPEEVTLDDFVARQKETVSD